MSDTTNAGNESIKKMWDKFRKKYYPKTVTHQPMIETKLPKGLQDVDQWIKENYPDEHIIYSRRQIMARYAQYVKDHYEQENKRLVELLKIEIFSQCAHLQEIGAYLDTEYAFWQQYCKHNGINQNA